MLKKQILYKDSLISYRCFGSGNRISICFHGYGEDADSFLFLEKHNLGNRLFIAVDLPFHGNTEWNEGLTFSPNDLLAVVESIVNSEGLEQANAREPIHLIGFSIGGRVALSLYELIPERIGKIILLAPDGLKLNFWYWLATQTYLGNQLFAFTMKYPKWYFLLLKLFYKINLVNASIYKFVQAYIHNQKVRKELYARWTCFRKLKPNLAAIKSKIKENKTNIRMIYGKHDRIIRHERGKKFMEGIEEHVELNIIRSGHQVLHEKHIHEIRAALLH